MELLPCPFCGSNRLTHDDAFVTCRNCSCTTPSDQWNTRASGWISVKDQLPKPIKFVNDCQISKKVLVNDNKIEIATYCVKHKDWQAEGMTLYNVSHWQELPYKPKENK